MSTASSSSSVFLRFFLPPSTSLNKGFFCGPRTFHPTSRAFRILESESPKNKLHILCFRHEHYLPKESVESEVSQSSVTEGDGDSGPQKATNAVLNIFGKRWVVPWGAKTILLVLLLWAAAFWSIHYWIIPFAANIAGLTKELSTIRGLAGYCLASDIIQGLAVIAVLYLCLSPYRPLPPDWFRFSLKGKWIMDVILGCLMFPVVNGLAQFNRYLVPQTPSKPNAVPSVKQAVKARDSVTIVLYAIALSICSPVWEEITFRGFLLPSLTKYMPVWCAIVVSSVAFAVAHFNKRRIMPLIFFGMMIGVVFTRSRNLLPSMLLHSLWNVFVFLYYFIKKR